MELSGDRGCQCKQAAHEKASESATLVKLAEDRHHTLDVSEAVEGSGGVPFYRALLECWQRRSVPCVKFPSPWSWSWWAAQGTTLE
jgi:hypothetical protein